MSAKNLAHFTRRQPSEASSQPSPRRAGEDPLSATPVLVDSDGLAVHFLRCFHLLLRSVRLYHQHHPRLIDSLKSTGRALDDALALLLARGDRRVDEMTRLRQVAESALWTRGPIVGTGTHSVTQPLRRAASAASSTPA